MLSPQRYEHSLGVRDTAVKLALRFGADPGKAELAGLLHDCAKNIPAEEALVLCERLGIELDEAERLNPALIHAPLGAELAQTEFGIHDEEIKNAIRYHTVGRAGMSLLEKVIYLADMIEPGRSFEGVEALRKAVEVSLDKALYEALKQSILHNAARGRIIHTGTVDAYNDLLK